MVAGDPLAVGVEEEVAGVVPHLQDALPAADIANFVPVDHHGVEGEPLGVAQGARSYC